MKRLRPTRAFVLAAGLGTRMLPLSRDLPKPLMPFRGKPLLFHTLRLLRRWGVTDVVVNVHHLPGEILEFVRRNPVPGLRVSLSHEPEILGTGGALRRAAWFLDGEPLWLINGDIAADLDPRPLIRAFTRGRCLAALWLHPSKGPRTVEMNRGAVTSFRSRRAGDVGTYTFCGLHLLSPEILRHLPDSGFAGIVPAYERALRAGRRIAGVVVPGSTWADLGTPGQYLEAHRTTGQGAWIGSHVTLERGARVGDSVIWDGARLTARARVRHAIVGRDTLVDGPVDHIALRADRALEAPESAALEAWGWPPAECTALPLGARGSARSFTRIRRSRRSVILMRYSLEREENGLYCRHARFLAELGLRVPRILLDRPADRLALLEDLGSVSLEQAAAGLPAVAGLSAATLRGLYRRILDDVLVLHSKGTRAARQARLPLMPPFSASLYCWERELFAREFLRCRLRLPERAVRGLLADLGRVARRLAGARAVLVHRDLQSSNILLAAGRPAYVDFQGMRFGPAAYDLASLLCDPYVRLAPRLQEDLLDYYAARAAASLSAAAGREAKDLFWWAAIERLVQALGAYARLVRLPGMGRFESYIPPALAALRRAVAHVDGLPRLRAWADRQRH